MRLCEQRLSVLWGCRQRCDKSMDKVFVAKSKDKAGDEAELHSVSFGSSLAEDYPRPMMVTPDFFP